MGYLLDDLEKTASEPKRDRAAEEAELDRRYADIKARGEKIRKSQLRALGVQALGATGVGTGAILGITPRSKEHNAYIKAGMLASTLPLAVGVGLEASAYKKARKLNDISAKYDQDLASYVDRKERDEYWETMRENMRKMKEER